MGCVDQWGVMDPCKSDAVPCFKRALVLVLQKTSSGLNLGKIFSQLTDPSCSM
jgi:hypothetical protein